MSKRLLFAACCVLWAVTCWAQTAIRPDQITPATPDITWGPGGAGYQIGSTVPWRTDSTTAPTFTAADNTKIVELTNAGAITATLPDATGGFTDGVGFTIQVAAGTLTLNRQTSSTINGLTTIKLGPYQSVGLVSRSGKWYATLSLPQPATQSGTTVLKDIMSWGAGASTTVALDGHGVGTSGGAAGTSNTVTITNSAAGETITVFWLYCRNGDASCNSGTGSPVLASAVAGTRGETCTLVPAAASFMAAGAAVLTAGVGAAFCTGTTSAGSDTITVTMSSAVNFLQVFAQSWTGATGTLDTACTNTTQQTTTTTSVSIPTAGNTTIANDAVVGLVAPSVGASNTGTGGTTVLDGAPGNLQQSTMYKLATATGPYSLTSTIGAAATWLGNVICIHP
jgi:hypothetical protein